jgi:hypothetical protein
MKGGFSIVADGNDDVGLLDGFVHVVAFRQRGGAHVELRPARYGAFAHLRCEIRDSGTQYELRDVLRRAGAGCRCS